MEDQQMEYNNYDMPQGQPEESGGRKKPGSFWKGFVCGALVLGLVVGGGAKAYTSFAGQYLVIGQKKAGVTKSTSGVIDRTSAAKIDELVSYMDLYYYDQYDKDAIRNAVYKGTLEGLGDPYSVYYTADEYADLMVNTSGNYYGIGAGLTQNAKTMEVTITKVYKGTPAEDAGLKDGDQILTVDDTEAASMELSNLVKQIRGEEGTKVHLKVFRGTTGDTLDFDVERRNVELPSVESEMVDGDIGYIQISEFQDKTAKQFDMALKELETDGMKGLLVDLRNNPGGLVKSVVTILDEILPEGTVVYTEDKYGNREDYDSDAACIDYPIVVLINGNSASASEIFAGAIKDYDYGTLLGTTSFGKGIVQSVFPLSDGDAVKITTAKYFTPKGNNIHGVGIEPDETLEYEYTGDKEAAYDKKYDNQLQRGVEILEGEIK